MKKNSQPSTQARDRKTPVILQVLPAMETGGAEQACIDMAAEITASGAKALVVSKGGPRLHALARTGAEHIVMPVHSKNPVRILLNARRLGALIREREVDIVHARSRAPAWAAVQAVKGTQARFMTTCHAPYAITGEIKRRYNSVMASGERVIAISEYTARYLTENYTIDPSVIRMIPRGIAMERFHPSMVRAERLITLSREWRLPEAASIVMLPARLTRWKGHHVLIEALARLEREDVFCLIIGSDQGRAAYRRELETLVADRGLSSRTRIVDHCEDMPAAYMLATVVAVPSIEPEGFGRVPVEAQAMGRPVVAADHGGASETIRHGETGWLVPPGNVHALAGALAEALDLPSQHRALLATRAMSHVAAHFTREHMVDSTMNVYAELLRKKMGIELKDREKAETEASEAA